MRDQAEAKYASFYKYNDMWNGVKKKRCPSYPFSSELVEMSEGQITDRLLLP